MTLQQAFAAQARACIALGSPFMGTLLHILAQDWPENSPLAQKMAAFEGDIGPSGHSLPLRIAGGLHALVLSGGAPELATLYPPRIVPEAALRAGILTALTQHQSFLMAWTDSAPQTNEVRRSAALIAGAHVALRHFDLPVYLSELGASGGLNLMWDHYALAIGQTALGPDDPALTLRPDWQGDLPPAACPDVAQRAGVDLNPLNPTRADHLLRLSAYLWPDQPDRLALTRAAASVAQPVVAKGDAIDWLAPRLSDAPEGHLHLIQHSVAWQYFPEHTQVKGRALIEAAGRAASTTRPLAWLSMESDGAPDANRGAALTLRLWPGDLCLALGRADFHGRWVQWTYAG
jgi:hypothetical protein